MRSILAIFALLFTVSCSTSTPQNGAVEINAYDYFEVNYNGPWSGNYISNGLIYGITNYGDAVYSNYDGMAIKKDDITSQVLELKLVGVSEYDLYTNIYTKARKVTSGSNVISIE